MNTHGVDIRKTRCGAVFLPTAVACLVLTTALFGHPHTLLAEQEDEHSPTKKAKKTASPTGDTPFFVHRTTESNTRSFYTLIDNKFANGDPTAILIVTPVWNPGAGGHSNNRPLAVWYLKDRWAIVNQDKSAISVGLSFNVAIMHANMTGSQVENSPATVAVPKAILVDGSVETRHSDGSVTLRSEGAETRIAPDGKRSTLMFENVQPNTPPVLPQEPDVALFLQKHNEYLLGLIAAAAADGQVSVDNYQRNESPGLTLYQQINRRTTYVRLMLGR